MSEEDEKEDNSELPKTNKLTNRRILNLFGKPTLRQHPDLDKYAGHLDRGVKIELEAHLKALEDVNQMVANQMISNQWTFTQEFNNRVQFHRNRLA